MALCLLGALRLQVGAQILANESRPPPILTPHGARSGLESLKPEEAAVLALLRSRLAKEAEGSRGRARAA
jgi:hypothetical protein